MAEDWQTEDRFQSKNIENEKIPVTSHLQDIESHLSLENNDSTKWNNSLTF